MERLVAIMARLRDPERGCEWDTVQTFETIAPYTIEEAYEVADAISRGNTDDLKDELGDLLLQVVFHARIAEEAGLFALPDVVAAISDKMERRHPHIFGKAADGGHHLWEQIKAAERAGKPDPSALAGVALGLPALLRAEKLQKRAARTGFDWPDASGARAKIAEEIAEVEAALSDAEREDEVGDLLFAMVNWARKMGIDPEAALRGANAKFERRFRAMEDIAGEDFADLTLDAKEALWVRVKVDASAMSHPTVSSGRISPARAVCTAFDGIAAAIAAGNLPDDFSAMRLDVSYGYDVPHGAGQPSVITPVLLVPQLGGDMSPYSVERLAEVCRDVVASVEEWFAGTMPSAADATLIFEIRAAGYEPVTIAVRLSSGQRVLKRS